MKLPQALNKKEQKREYDKKWRLKNYERIQKQKKEYFSRPETKERVKEYKLKTKEHRREYDKHYFLKNKEKRKKQQKIWALKNKEKLNKQQKHRYHAYINLRLAKKEYQLKNRVQINKRMKHRYHTDINFRLLTNCRKRVLAALKGSDKSASTIKLIGCTIDELRQHIESKFESWMTWENHGLWDIDHIQACAKFDFTYPEQQRECFHWSNLQPLDHIENMKKGAR